MNNNIQLFPARISDRVVKASEMSKGASASGGYSPTTDSAMIPASDSAYARKIRQHESGHAIWSRETPLKYADMIGQAVEDAVVETSFKNEGSPRRDELTAAITDLRAVKKGGLPTKTRALDGLIMIRSAAILLKPEPCGIFEKRQSSPLAESILRTLVTKYHPHGPELLREILSEVQSGNRDRARALTSKFFNCSDMPDMSDESGEGEGMPDDGEESKSKQPGQSGKGKPQPGENPIESEPSDGEPEPSDMEDSPDTDGDETETENESGDGVDGARPSPFTDAKPKPEITEEPLKDEIQGGKFDDYIPAPVKKGERICALETARRDSEDGTIETITGDDGTPVGGKYRGKGGKYRGKGGKLVAIPYPILYVHTLSPNATRRVRGRGRNTWKSAEQGVKIRVNRLALNAANPCGGGRLFETRHLGGTVLIDASASMHVNDNVLYAIAEKFPAGKVAYYSGKLDRWLSFCFEGDIDIDECLEKYWSGNLVVYAQNGRIRKNHGECLPKRDGANLVDYQAILWLLKQPGPRYLMTDGISRTGFTGPLAWRALALLNDAVATKKITVYPSMPALMAVVEKIH